MEQFMMANQSSRRSHVRDYARVLYENYRVHVMASRKQEMPEWNKASIHVKREFINEADQMLF